jgi:hypothetical protein
MLADEGFSEMGKKLLDEGHGLCRKSLPFDGFSR